MPFARYFCIFINVGLGEGSAKRDVGTGKIRYRTALFCQCWMDAMVQLFLLKQYGLVVGYPTNRLQTFSGEFSIPAGMTGRSFW